MKHIFATLLFYCILITVKSQSITPLQSNEFCPGVEYTFTASITKPYSSMIGEGSCFVTQLPTQPVGTTFIFKGKFGDVNQKQTFRIYHTDGSSTPFDFKKIKSLFYGTCAYIQPNQINVTAATCQIVNIPVSFNNIQWKTAFEPSATTCFGSITDYEYQLPANWKIGNSTSTGSNWIQGNNNVTVTTDLSTTGNILVRPRNACGVNLLNGQPPSIIYVTRPAPSLAINTNPTSINCGSATPVTFSLSGSATGITGYTWNLGSTNNGWLYNGSPAPATINTGMVNNVILTPVTGTGTAPSQVSVTVTFTGSCQVNYTKNLPFIVPGSTFTILGNDVPCRNTINTYTLQQTPPLGTNVIWSIPNNDGTVTFTPNGNSVEVDASNASPNGYYILNVAVTGYCYSGSGSRSFVIPTNSWSGSVSGYYGWSNIIYNADLVEGDNNLYLYGTSAYEISVAGTNAYPSTSYWEYISGDRASWGGAYTSYLGFDFSVLNGVDSYYNFSYTDNCGTHTIPYHFIGVYAYPPQNRSIQPPKEKYKISISPNPTNSIANIMVIETDSKAISRAFDYNTPKTISVYDRVGTLVMQRRQIVLKSGIRLDVSALRTNNIYNVIIEDRNGIRLFGKLIK